MPLAPLIPTVLRTTGMVFRVVSPSLPEGWYWTTSQDSVIVGYPTLACYPQDVVSFGVSRGYLFPDSTHAQSRYPQTLVYVIKPIAALPGDTVTRDSLRVHGSQPMSTNLTQKNALSRIPSEPMCSTTGSALR